MLNIVTMDEDEWCMIAAAAADDDDDWWWFSATRVLNTTSRIFVNTGWPPCTISIMFAIPYHFDSLRLFRSFKHENSKHVIIESPDSSKAFFNQHCTGFFFCHLWYCAPPCAVHCVGLFCCFDQHDLCLGCHGSKNRRNEDTLGISRNLHIWSQHVPLKCNLQYPC